MPPLYTTSPPLPNRTFTALPQLPDSSTLTSPLQGLLNPGARTVAHPVPPTHLPISLGAS